MTQAARNHEVAYGSGPLRFAGATYDPTSHYRAAEVFDLFGERVVTETGAHLVHPYDDPVVIAGQGRCALELADQVPDLDLIVAPVGGGGLLSGTVLGLSLVAPSVEVVGVEPAGADDAKTSLAAGTIVSRTTIDTIADGLGPPSAAYLSRSLAPAASASRPSTTKRSVTCNGGSGCNSN